MNADYMFPAFLPDQSINTEALRVAENVYPAIDGFRPIKKFREISVSLPASFMGGASFISDNGTAYIFAGTASGLYRLDGENWTQLVNGLAVTDRWRYVSYGNFAISVNKAVTREIDLTAGTQAVLANAPSGNSVCEVGGFVIIGQANGNILDVQWSDIGNHREWVTGSSGNQPQYTGGEIMGLAGGEFGVILQRFRLTRMSLTGDTDAPFQFDEISSNFGCASSASIAQAGRTVFYYSDRGWMALDDGQAPRPIGNEKIDRAFAATVSGDDLERLWTAVDPQNKLLFAGIPGGAIWIYNWELDKWATAMLPFSGIVTGYTSNMSLEDVSAAFPDLDAMTVSLDDLRFAGGDPRLYLFDDSNRIGTLSGDNLQATFEAPFKEAVKGRRTRLNMIRPITDATSGITFTADCRQRVGDGQNLTTVSHMQSSGYMPIRCSGKYISDKLVIAAGTNWSYIKGYEIQYEAGGMR